MKTTVFLDSFSGAIEDMKKKDQSDPVKVLSVLSKHPRFSIYDATGNLVIAKTLTELYLTGLIVDAPKREYPWFEIEITERGKEALVAATLSERNGD